MGGSSGKLIVDVPIKKRVKSRLANGESNAVHDAPSINGFTDELANGESNAVHDAPSINGFTDEKPTAEGVGTSAKESGDTGNHVNGENGVVTRPRTDDKPEKRKSKFASFFKRKNSKSHRNSDQNDALHTPEPSPKPTADTKPVVGTTESAVVVEANEPTTVEESVTPVSAHVTESLSQPPETRELAAVSSSEPCTPSPVEPLTSVPEEMPKADDSLIVSEPEVSAENSPMCKSDEINAPSSPLSEESSTEHEAEDAVDDVVKVEPLVSEHAPDTEVPTLKEEVSILEPGSPVTEHVLEAEEAPAVSEEVSAVEPETPSTERVSDTEDPVCDTNNTNVDTEGNVELGEVSSPCEDTESPSHHEESGSAEHQGDD